jgi:hypothetical protein
MQCDDVIRELAAPTDEQNSMALAEHLANCASCARWAQRAALLDRLWEATRPPEPTPDTWNAVWSGVSQSLDLPVLNGVGSFNSAMRALDLPHDATDSSRQRRPASGSRRWTFAAVVCVGLAQAAAVVMAVGFTWITQSRTPHGQVAVVSKPARLSTVGVRVAGSIEIEEGHVVLIETQMRRNMLALPLCLSSLTMVPVAAEVLAFRVIDRIPEGMSFGVDHWYEMFNTLEGIANPPIVASR